MIKIGDFSKLAHIYIKTLHHYDDLGLLRPVHVDRYTAKFDMEVYDEEFKFGKDDSIFYIYVAVG